MSLPGENYEDKHRGAMVELLSAQSSLNMYPDPIDPDDSSVGYLSETDRWAKHACEHLDKGMTLLNDATLNHQLLQDAVMLLLISGPLADKNELEKIIERLIRRVDPESSYHFDPRAIAERLKGLR